MKYRIIFSYKNNAVFIELIVTLALLLFLLFFFCCFSSRSKVVMSYFVPEDQVLASLKNVGDNQQFKDKIDHLNILAYAFLKVNSDGKIIFNENELGLSEKNINFCRQNKVICKQSKNQFAHIGSFDFFYFLHNQSQHLKKIVSLGGADDKTSFFYVIKNADNFVNSVGAIIDEYQLSGLDFDFEINRPYTPDEAKLYADIIAKLRKRIGTKKLISMASIIDQETLQSMGADNWKLIAKNADFISLMCYDLISPFNQPAYTEFASNLYLIPNEFKFLHNANSSCDQSINYLTTLGVPITQIVLGIPAYAIAYGGVGSKNDGLFQPSIPSQTPAFDDMGKGLLRYSTVLNLNKKGFKEHISMSNGYVNGVWSYNPETLQFITFDNPESIRDKVDYVLQNNLAGVMMWRIGQDVPISNKRSLLKTIVEGLHR